MSTSTSNLVASTKNWTLTESKALELLGSGLPAEQVANCLGVDPSRISQLMGQEDFAAAVRELRFNALQEQNKRDNKADAIEDQLLDKLGHAIPMMFKPMEILKAYQTVNAAKRRGQSAPAQLTNQQTVVNLLLPQRIIQQFVVNQENQVIKAGDQDLLTMQAGPLLREAQAKLAQLRSPENDSAITATPTGERGNELPVPATIEREVGGSEQGAGRSSSQISFVPVR